MVGSDVCRRSIESATVTSQKVKGTAHSCCMSHGGRCAILVFDRLPHQTAEDCHADSSSCM